jgi:hypothetical protein
MRARRAVVAIAAVAVCSTGIAVGVAGGTSSATGACGGTLPTPIVTPVDCQSFVSKANNVMFAATGMAPSTWCSIDFGDPASPGVVMVQATSRGNCTASHVYQQGGSAPLYRLHITLAGTWGNVSGTWDRVITVL